MRKRGANDLTPIDTRAVPREVAPLIHAINAHTERQRQLSEAQARFVANASHQLKTPLTVLRAQVGHALMQTDLDTMRAVVTRLHETTDTTGRMVGQLLALARSEPGRSLEVQDVDLTALAREVSFEMLSAARSKGIDLGFEGGDPVLVRGEHVLLHELIANVVHNAIVYTQERGRVTVSVGQRPVASRAAGGRQRPRHSRCRASQGARKVLSHRGIEGTRERPRPCHREGNLC